MFHVPCFRFQDNGQAVLSLVLLIGSIIAFVSVTLAFIALGFINSSTGFERANRALAVASAGVEDALMRLTRNKDLSATSPYTFSVGSSSVAVTITQGSPVSGQATVVSGSSVGPYTRQVQAIVAITSSTGEVQLISWGELSL